MKIYTKTGDKGETGLMGGERVSKDSLRVAAYGEVDELNAVLGVCLAQIGQCEHAHPKSISKKSAPEKGLHRIQIILHQIQQELFSLGSDLSTPYDLKIKVPRIHHANITQLEKWIDVIEDELPALKNFILPGGSLLAAHLHLARTVCRRAERTIVSLEKTASLNQSLLVYVNRLSDLLFVMARFANSLEKKTEEKWNGG